METATAPGQDFLFSFEHRDAYRQIRNYLAGRLVGATRDESLLREVIKCLFCKLFLKREQMRPESPRDALALAKLYRDAFSKLREQLPLVFEASEELLLDPASLAYVDQRLESAELESQGRDPFGDAYEVFMGSGVRGQEGQFFTPQNAVQLLVSIVDPRRGEKVIDPACGAGGFLSGAARHLLDQGASPGEVAENVFGIDKDRYLVGLAASRLSLLTLAPANIYCADSLAWKAENGQDHPLPAPEESFDVLLTNPPFGARIVSVSREVQASFELGHRWVLDEKTQRLFKSQEIQNSVPPQTLFVERCLSLVRPGGRIGMVVPESLISGSNYRYVVQFMRDQADIRVILGMPESLFKISGKGGTHTKTCLIVLEKKDKRSKQSNTDKIFMAEAQWCGHDSRGRQIGRDELPAIIAKYREFRGGALKGENHLGYEVSAEKIRDNVLAPRYYNPDVESELALLRRTHDLINFGDLVASGLVRVTTGDEVGKLNYGSGPIPFVRTSDISNWEIKVDPKHCVSEEIYEGLAKKQDVREGDILMVRDGTYLIGTCAVITKYDIRILFQSHLYKLRVLDHSKLSPYLLLAVLSSAPLQKQIRAKQFTQDIIDSLGDRIHELVLPIPKDKTLQRKVARTVEEAVSARIEARELARKACLEVVAGSPRRIARGA
jgi:type I restriction enzyme M protein